MAERFGASGRWHVRAGEEEAFVLRWKEFLGWRRETFPELLSATLLRSETEPDRFVSFALWADATARKSWQQSDGFATRFGACRELCDAFEGGDFTVPAAFGATA